MPLTLRKEKYIQTSNRACVLWDLAPMTSHWMGPNITISLVLVDFCPLWLKTFRDFQWQRFIFLSCVLLQGKKPTTTKKKLWSFWCSLAFTGAAFSALPSVKFITGLQYVINLINAIPGVFTSLLKGSKRCIWCGLPEAWVVWWMGLTIWHQSALTGKSGTVCSQRCVHAGQ